ncbi:MAG: AgrD family cyclic lactone autoinducer peptide [Flavipsychrobacter sp.]|nr:cyclic lactone autoinducer peptide [Chitinophagales bacterium]
MRNIKLVHSAASFSFTFTLMSSNEFCVFIIYQLKIVPKV